MATSIASQLQALKSVVKADTEPLKKPFIRPSVIFNPKDAADIDIDTIFNLALSGLEVLISKDEGFRIFKRDLFNQKSKELDRELVGIEENNRIKDTIGSYLKLLSGYFELLAARRTLEYLIRRYKIHVYNIEELILCALPYHDTPEFVRVVQLIDTGNTRWKFLDGVKASGAPPPRKVIVQQCISDLGVLEIICNFAMPAKKTQPVKAIIGFCTAVVIEVLGSMTAVNSDVVNRILPYLLSGLQPGANRKLEHKAGALMIVGLLAQKVKLSSNLVKSLVRSVVDVVREDAEVSDDLQWFRLPLMALINLVQLQHVRLIPRKSMDILLGFRDITEILGGLSEEFNIDKFLTVFLNSLLEHSSAEQTYHHTLMVIIETIPLKFYVDCLVSKLLKTCMRMSRNMEQPNASESGNQAKEILVSLYKKYPVELREAINKILQDNEMQSGTEVSSHELFSKMLDRDGDFSMGVSHSKFLFALEHPRAEVRRHAVMGLDIVGILRDRDINVKVFGVIQDALMHRLLDDDLSVIEAVFNVQHLNEIISSSVLLDAFQSVLDRCICMLMSGASENRSIASDVAVSCLQLAITTFKDQDEFTKKLAKMIFPLVLIQPKTQRVNLEALELSKEIKWSLYGSLTSLSRPEKLGIEHISAVNLANISKLAEDFWMHCDELMPWLLECSDTNKFSKTIFFLILLQSSMVPKPDFARFSVIYDASFQLLQREWEVLEFTNSVSNAEESNVRTLDGDCGTFLKRLLHISSYELNAEILLCLFWKLVEAFIVTAPDNAKNEKWLCKLENLFVFFASQSSQVFRKHLHYLVTKCKSLLLRFLCKMFTDEGFSGQVQAESLHSFEHLCSLVEVEKDLPIQLLSEFPSLLVPLASNDQDVRMVAMSCIEELFKLWTRDNLSRSKNGNSAVWIHFLGELLDLIVQQKMLVLSDPNVLPSTFKSLLSSSTDGLLVQQNIGKRFDQSTKDGILVFLLGSTLGLSAYAKLKILSLLKGLGNKVTEVIGVKSLLNDLLERRQQYHIMHNKSSQKLSKTDIDILCLLLEICTMPTLSFCGHGFEDLDIIKALELNGSASEDPAIVEPCITVLKNLSNSVYGVLKAETQEILFRDLVIMLRNGNADMQNSTRDALLQINISYLVVKKMLEFVVHHLSSLSGSSLGKKKKKFVAHQDSDVYLDVFQRGENALSFLSSLLDVLILKKNMENRSSLIGSLFELLRLIFVNDEWVHGTLDEDNKCFQASSGVSHTVSNTQVYIQQTLLLILEDITSSAITNVPEKDDIVNKFDLKLLVKCAHLASDAVTCNHVLSLFSTIAKVMPDKVLDHILDILNIIGESAVTKWDAYSQSVFEGVISAVVPFWLSETGDAEKVLQIFVDILPQVPQHQKLLIIVCLLRNLGESGSFGSLLFVLFNSLVSKERLFCFADGELSTDSLTSIINTQWEYLFAMELSAQYSCMIWLPSLVLLLRRIGMGPWTKEHYMQLIVAMQFVFEKLQDPGIKFKLDSGEDTDVIQMTLGALMEQVIYLLQPADVRDKSIVVSPVIKKGLKELMRLVLKTIVRSLKPFSYFKVMIQLLRHADKNVRKKALGLLCETAKESGIINKSSERRGSGKSLRSSWLQFDETAQKSFDTMCLEILKFVDDSDVDSGGASLKLAAVSTLEALAYRFPSDNSILVMCLKSVSKNISSHNSTVSSASLRTASALIHVLGPRALSELPGIMEHMFRKSRDSFLLTAEDINIHDDNYSVRNLKDSIVMSILIALEAVVDKLGGLLNPYLSSILELLVLHPCYVSTADVKIKLRADVVRKLVTDKIPVRLLLPALLRIYTDTVKSGGSSVSTAFEILGNLVQTMDRSAVAAYHVQIFNLGLLALDLRCQRTDSIKDIHVVEEKIINSIVCLTMKLTETMFKPLFVKSIEWSRSYVEESERSKNIDRSISFYGLVNKLAESHRSLFVPYFKYLLDGCVHHLVEETQVGLARKKKKVKLQEASNEEKDTGNKLSLGIWHLRSLIISSLHQCFLYDTGSLKFLDSSNFQVLLKPIVSQLVADPPPYLEHHAKVPSVEEVDDLLVACIGQMAITAESDLLWKPLNHEVLMQTRSEKVRPRILGLRIVKYLVENLKEEYLVLLPETIPFLGELMEDVELDVKTLAQDILKQMEFMSGESLRQYL